MEKPREFQKNIYFCFTNYAKAFDCVNHNKLWKILRDGNTTPPDLPPEKSVCGSGSNRTRYETTDWLQIGKGVHQDCISSPCLFNLYAKYIMRNARLDEAQVAIKIARRKINHLRYADDTTLMAEREEVKSLLMKVKEESEKVSLKLNIQKTKIMASGPITSWQIDGETMETVTLFLGAPKLLQMVIAAMKLRYLLLGRKVMTKLDSMLKSRRYFANKCLSSQSYCFSSSYVWIENWTRKKAEHSRTDAFELWCWRRLLRVTWTARRLQPVHRKGNQS